MLISNLEGVKTKDKIDVICDYCGLQFQKLLKDRKVQNKELDKDACKGCKHQKRLEIYAMGPPIVLSDIPWETYKDEITNLYKEGFSEGFIAEKLNVPRTSLQRQVKKWTLPKPSIKGYDKAKKTYKEKLGNGYRDILNKNRDNAIKEKYGVDNVFQLDSVKQKSKETMQLKYGVDYAQQSPKLQEKSKKTIQKKYGVDNIAQSKDIQEKIKATNLKRYGFSNPMQNNEVKKKLLTTLRKNGRIFLYKKQTYREIAKERGYSLGSLKVLIWKYGIDKAYTMNRFDNYSSLEKVMMFLLDQNNIKYQTEVTIKDNNKVYRADFIIEDKMIIEVDGLYWHSSAKVKNDYHYNKRNAYINQGYIPLFFREYEVNNNPDIVMSFIKNKLNLLKPIDKDKCTLDIVSIEKSREFLETHNMTGCHDGDSFGLYYNQELVSVMQVKNTVDDYYEISSFCNHILYNIEGSFSKLLEYAERYLSMKSISYTSDLRYNQLDLSQYNFINTECNLTCQYTINTSIYDTPVANGNEIWDCGQAKWVKTY